MLGTPTDFWGKLRRSGPTDVVTEWHPLIDHCADVAAVAEALLGLPVWRARFGRLAGCDLTDRQRARLSVLAALHDLGKFNLGFQAKGRSDLGPPAGHVAEAVAALTRGTFPSLVVLAGWGESIEDLLLAAIGHHGRPIKPGNVDAQWRASQWDVRSNLDPKSGVRRLLACNPAVVPRSLGHG